jgi:hypothetical protein
MMTVEEFAWALVRFCIQLRASVTSHYRTAAHNAAVGGVAGSAHRAGLGADVVYDAPVDETLRRETAAQLGLGLLVESDHDHLQPASWGVKKQ